MTAEMTRWVPGEASARANRGPVAALAAAVVGDRLFEVAAPEIRPQRLGEDELGIGALPQQEIADALLAAGADQQVRVGQIGGEQVAGDRRLVDLLRGDLPGRRGLRVLSRCAFLVHWRCS